MATGVMLGSLAVVATAGAGTAVAHQKSFPTSVRVAIELTPPSQTGRGLFAGRVTSPRAACVAGRRLKAIAVFNDGSRRVVDRARTSTHGGFGLTFDVTGVDFGIIRVDRKRLGPKRKSHRHICRPARIGGSGGAM